MTTKPTVVGALRQFIPSFLNGNPPLSPEQRRALWAITHCRTAAMGWDRYVCDHCGVEHFAYHSCNHRACPLCGRAATAEWVERQLSKQINAPYFMVTFTVPQELRECFFGPPAKKAFDMLFASASSALSEKLAANKEFPAAVSGFVAVLHTWTQQLNFDSLAPARLTLRAPLRGLHVAASQAAPFTRIFMFWSPAREWMSMARSSKSRVPSS